MIRLDSRLVPPEIVEAFARDILLVLRHVAKNRDGAHEETEDGEPYLSVIRATQFDDAAVAEIDTLADLTLWVTDAENPEDGPVRDAAKRLLRAARADGR